MNISTNWTRYIDGMPTFEVTLVTIQYMHPPHHGHTKVYVMAMNGRLMSFLNHAIPEIRLFQTLTLNFQFKVMGVIKRQCYVVSPVYTWFTSVSVGINQDKQCLRYRYIFRFNLKNPRSRSLVRARVKVTQFAQYPTDAVPFQFASIGPTIP